MILFLGDSFTWGQGLYFEKWRDAGIDVMKWKKSKGDLDIFPHENLDYESHQYRRHYHFPSLVAKHYDRNYDVKWGNGGSNWDLIHQANMIPVLSPQYRNGLDLVVVQLTDWTRTDNRLLYKNDIYEQTPIPNIDYIQKDRDWEAKLVDKMMIDEQMFQLNKLKEIFEELGLRWIVISWRNDMGNIVKEHFPENYVPFYYKNKEYTGFEVCLQRGTGYTLEDEFLDGHLNIKGCELVADSIIRKIESMGGKSLFTYIKPENKILI
jgi:lysophospholipase L1-like esterase